MRAKIQKFGGILSAMVMPNIGAFIAWGLLTALFLYPTGWFPNENMAKLITPILTYFLPAMIGYTAGENIYGKRGGVIAGLVTMGVIVGTDITMFMGAMIVGPLAAMLMKWVDSKLEGKAPAGFEMIVNNFSMGFLGLALVIIAYMGFGPIIQAINLVLSAGVNWIIEHHLIPFASVFIEPAKVLFLNNAINHGILSPIGVTQAAEAGKSILFILEPNPGPGLGVLLAYSFFGKGDAKSSAPGVAIIHCIGGIHEPYFPFILMKPQMILASICGAVCGNFVFAAFNVGLVATASPGSFFSILAVAPRTDWIPILLGIFLATAVSFAVGSVILKLAPDTETGAYENAVQAKNDMKAEGAAPVETAAENVFLPGRALDFAGMAVSKICFACDAGMGSSVMAANILQKKVKQAGLDIEVMHESISHLPVDVQMIVTHESLVERAHNERPGMTIVALPASDNFVNSPRYNEIVEALQRTEKQHGGNPEAAAGTPAVRADKKKADPAHALLFDEDSIFLGKKYGNKLEAIREAGQILADRGCVTPDYIQAMIDRDREFSVYIGNGVAIPHGVAGSEKYIRRSGISFLQVPDGVAFGKGEVAKIVIGIAGADGEHLDILARLAALFEDETNVDKLVQATTKKEILDMIRMAEGQ